jgi:hypothetical protein
LVRAGGPTLEIPARNSAGLVTLAHSFVPQRVSPNAVVGKPVPVDRSFEQMKRQPSGPSRLNFVKLSIPHSPRRSTLQIFHALPFSMASLTASGFGPLAH